MALSLQDFVKGVDFTGLNPATGANHNNLVELAAPYSDDASNGKALILWTVDSALNTPIVPDANTIVKWKRYIWLRIPHVSAASKKPIPYGWNDNAVNDATLKKWKDLGADLTEIDSDITQLQADVIAAKSTADAANITSNAAASQAATALSTANDAKTTATSASDDAASAVTLATAASTGSVEIARIVPGTAGKKLRTNAAGAALEYFLDLNNYVKIVERAAKGVNGPNGVAGLNTRLLAVIANDDGALIASVVAGVVTVAVAGTYLVKAWGMIAHQGAHQIFIIKNGVAGVPVLEGSGSTESIKNQARKDGVEGILTLVAGDTLRIDHYLTDTSGGFSSMQFGLAANLNPNAAGFETYASLELFKLN